MESSSTKKKLSNAAELRAAIQESVQTNPALLKEILGEDAAPSLKEAADRAYQQLLQDDDQLERILVARKYKSGSSQRLFWHQVSFRAEFQPGRIRLDQIPTALPSGAWRLCGYTKDGHVLGNYRLDHWDPDAYGDDLDQAVQEYVLYVCYMIERMIEASTKHDKFSMIFDLSAFYVGMVVKKNIREMIGELISVAQMQYPERLERVYMVNAPWGFQTAWSLIRPVLDAKTASKIQFCSTPEQLLEDVDADTLSVAYGGNHEEYPIPT